MLSGGSPFVLVTGLSQVRFHLGELSATASKVGTVGLKRKAGRPRPAFVRFLDYFPERFCARHLFAPTVSRAPVARG
jgi:hypothetical protein